MIFGQVKRFIRILFIFQMHVYLLLFYFCLSRMVIFYINFSMHITCAIFMSWLVAKCMYTGFSMTYRKKANSLKPSGKGFKTQCASPLGVREPIVETKSEEKILSLEASQWHNHSFSCNSSNVPTIAINNVMKQITCYPSQLWSMESNWPNFVEKKITSQSGFILENSEV